MSKHVVLVTAGTSKTGSEAANQLLATGKFTVRSGTRDPVKLAAFVGQGGEAVVIGTTLESTIQAFTGVDFVYIVWPGLRDGALTSTYEIFLQAAKQTGVKHIVYLSDINVDSPDNFKTVHNHYDQEQMLMKTGIPFTIFRCTWFHENTLVYHAASIKYTGELRSSAGDGVWTSVGIQDIAAATVAVLADPSKHADKFYTLTEESLTDAQLAEKLSKVTGKKVTHVNMAPEDYAELLNQMLAGTPQIDQFVDALLLLDKNKRDGRFSVVHPDLEMLLGHKGISVEEFLAKHADAFN